MFKNITAVYLFLDMIMGYGLCCFSCILFSYFSILAYHPTIYIEILKHSIPFLSYQLLS